jgi:RNA polymerase sigma-70 factor (ECF subfamily)
VVTRIDRVLAGLPSSQREAFELIKYRGLSLADAAGALGTTVAAVKQRVHRAYEAVCFALGDPTGAAWRVAD